MVGLALGAAALLRRRKS
ncbi:MAG: hypothetical protein JJU05_07800 [Verrucomicrobia bacterium]|nr:hypothetical protein [Verrucomicrobiota bacterium]